MHHNFLWLAKRERNRQIEMEGGNIFILFFLFTSFTSAFLSDNCSKEDLMKCLLGIWMLQKLPTGMVKVTVSLYEFWQRVV